MLRRVLHALAEEAWACVRAAAPFSFIFPPTPRPTKASCKRSSDMLRATLLLLLSLGPGFGLANSDDTQHRSVKKRTLAQRRKLNSCSPICTSNQHCMCSSSGRRLFGAPPASSCECVPYPPPPSPTPAPPPLPAYTHWRIANHAVGTGTGAWCVAGIRFYTDDACTVAPSYMAISSSGDWSGQPVSNVENVCYDSAPGNDWNMAPCGSTRCSASSQSLTENGAWIQVEYDLPTTIKCAVAWYTPGHTVDAWATKSHILQAKIGGVWTDASAPTETCDTIGSCPIGASGGTWARKMSLEL